MELADGRPAPAAGDCTITGHWRSPPPPPCPGFKPASRKEPSHLLRNLAGLTPGTYSATVTLTPVFAARRNGIPNPVIHHPRIELTVTAAPLLTAPYCCGFLTANPGVPVNPSSLPITSNGDPVHFTITTSGESWLSLNVDQGTTPATLVLTADPAGLQSGTYTAEILVHGPNNTLTLPVYLTVISSAAAGRTDTGVANVLALCPRGRQLRNSDQSVTHGLRFPQAATFTVRILSGGDWLKTQTIGNIVLSVNASAVNLAPGDYAAQIVVSATGFTPVTVPVSLTVLPLPAPSTLRVSPAAISLTGLAAVEQDATLAIDSSAGPLLVQPSASASASWLHFSVHSDYIAADGKFLTPATLTIYANSGQPGTFRGAITLETTNDSMTVPVTLDATPPCYQTGPDFRRRERRIGTHRRARSRRDLQHLRPRRRRHGVRQWRARPAPLHILRTGQRRRAVRSRRLGNRQGEGRRPPAYRRAEWGIPLAAAAPAIFTLDASGTGPGAILNQDSSVNSAANPAARGSVIQIFGTGQGLTSPPSITGAIGTAAGNPAVLPVKAAFGGVDAIVQYQGAAPGLIAGALQVNVLVPLNAATGDAVPLTISIGGVASQPGVTVAVR